MGLRRFYCPEIPAPSGCVDLPASESGHALRVLRLGAGDRLVLLDGKGVRAEAELLEPERTGRRRLARCRVIRREQLPPPEPRLRLLVAPPRGKGMELILRQATEMGVWRIVPILCQYSVRQQASEPAARAGHADIVAAAKQSGNAFFPELTAPVPFAAAIATTPGAGYFGDTAGLAPAAPELQADSREISLWIGPEGGFSATERVELLALRQQPVCLGRWVLRVQTAVPALLGWLMGRLDDSGRRQSP